MAYILGQEVGMGHTWREMDPVGAAESDRRIDRTLKLQKQLKNLSLSNFTVGELEAVMSLLGLAGTSDPEEEHLVLLEKKVVLIKKRS